MNWTRGGTKQRAKAAEQYKFYSGNPGLALMMRFGFTVGKGLGDGRGRIGAPWGLKGRPPALTPFRPTPDDYPCSNIRREGIKVEKSNATDRELNGFSDIDLL